MHIGNLDESVLEHVFHILAKQYDVRDAACRRELVEVGLVCRSWSGFVLPFIHQTVYVEHDGRSTKTSISHALSSNVVGCAQELEITIVDRHLDDVELLGVLRKAKVTRVVWPHISKLAIRSECRLVENHRLSSFEGTALAAKAAADCLYEHVPNAVEFRCFESMPASDICTRPHGHSDYGYALTRQILSRYTTQLAKLDVSLSVDLLTKKLSLPQQLTHLDVTMDSYEKIVGARIPVSLLQRLGIRDASVDITWNWFDSGDCAKVLFGSLKELYVNFGGQPLDRRCYHNGDLTKVDMCEFKSDYYEYNAPRVQFPVLEKLTVVNYSYYDDGFYRLFEKCPLKYVDIKSPRSLGYFVPSRMLTKPQTLKLSMSLSHRQSGARRSQKEKDTLLRRDYHTALTSLFSCPSAAVSVQLRVDSLDTMTLPAKLGWKFVQKLDLQFTIGMESIVAILVQMPVLRRLRIQLCETYLNGVQWEAARNKPSVANESVEYLGFEIHSCSSRNSLKLWRFLSDLLRMVPSLLKAETSYEPIGSCLQPMTNQAEMLNCVDQHLQNNNCESDSVEIQQNLEVTTRKSSSTLSCCSIQ